MAKKSFIVATYDIVDDKRRTKLMKTMKNYGPRVQKSVFEFIIDAEMFRLLKQQCREIIDMEKDSVRFYKICATCRKEIEVLGWGLVSDDALAYIV